MILPNSHVNRHNTYIDAEEAGEAMEVVLVTRQLQHLRYDRLLRPIHAKLLHKLLQVHCGRLPHCVYCTRNNTLLPYQFTITHRYYGGKEMKTVYLFTSMPVIIHTDHTDHDQ